jgi:uncharacterized damage-inducible protein DinB
MKERTPFVTMEPLDERESLRRWLDYHRDTLIYKVQGVDADGLAFSPVGSGTSLGGLIRHMYGVEAYWFQDVLKGEIAPDRWDDAWERNGDFSGDELIAIFEEACEASRKIEHEAASLDQLAVGSVTWAEGARPSLRWVMNHVIEEEARHNGHADLLREMVDGSVGD